MFTPSISSFLTSRRQNIKNRHLDYMVVTHNFNQFYCKAHRNSFHNFLNKKGRRRLNKHNILTNPSHIINSNEKFVFHIQVAK